jgi:hypothetical protein
MASAHARFIDQRDLAKLRGEVLNSQRKARKNAESDPELAYAGGTLMPMGGLRLRNGR